MQDSFRQPEYLSNLSRNRLILSLFGWCVAAVCLLVSAVYQSPVNDEFGHLYAGLRYWQHADSAMFNVNPPLLRSIAALPGLASGLRADDQQERFSAEPLRLHRPEFPLGRQLFIRDPTHFQWALTVGRLSVVAVTLLGGWLLMSWARQLVGQCLGESSPWVRCAGWMAAGFWLAQPQILSHGALITGDVVCAVMMLATLRVLVWTVEKLSAIRAILLGAILAIAILCKFTALALVPLIIFALAWNAHRYSLVQLLGGLVLVGFTVLLIVPIPYRFQGIGQDFLEYEFVSGTFREWQSQLEIVSSRIPGASYFDSGRVPLSVPIPAEMLLGIDRQQFDFEMGLPSFAAGIRSDHGWWWFYLYSMLVKLPLGTWLAITGSIVIGIAGGTKMRSGLMLPSLLILILLLITAAQDGFAQQHRYILPVYPALFLSVAVASVRAMAAPGMLQWVGGGCLIGLGMTVIGSAMVAPHWLGAFNVLAGGNQTGYRCLFNDASDWGQDTYRVRDWIASHSQGEQVYVRSSFSGERELAAVGGDFLSFNGSIDELVSPCWIVVSKSDLAMDPGLYEQFRTLPAQDYIGSSHIVYRWER